MIANHHGIKTSTVTTTARFHFEKPFRKIGRQIDEAIDGLKQGLKEDDPDFRRPRKSWGGEDSNPRSARLESRRSDLKERLMLVSIYFRPTHSDARSLISSLSRF